MVKQNPALAVSELMPESPTLGLEELLTAAHDIMHGLTELPTPAHAPERMACEVASTTKTPDTSSAVKSATLRIANGFCAQDKRAREREAQEREERKRERGRESAKKNSVRATMHEAASKE